MISLNFRDSSPIYMQVKESLRRLIISGGMQPDEKLMSVRELASELAINPNTIQRAYREMEQEGYIYSIPGKGSFVCANLDVNAGRKEELWKQFEASVTELLYLNVSPQMLHEKIDKKAVEK